MLVDTRNVEDMILAALQNDGVLVETINSFTKGDLNTSKKLFPFVVVEVTSYEEGSIRAASGTLVYSVDVFAGTRSIAPGVAYGGSDSGKKGIAEICNEIKRVVENNRFSNTFIHPTTDIQVDPRYSVNKDETVCIGRVAFKNEIRYRHR